MDHLSDLQISHVLVSEVWKPTSLLSNLAAKGNNSLFKSHHFENYTWALLKVCETNRWLSKFWFFKKSYQVKMGGNIKPERCVICFIFDVCASHLITCHVCVSLHFSGLYALFGVCITVSFCWVSVSLHFIWITCAVWCLSNVLLFYVYYVNTIFNLFSNLIYFQWLEITDFNNNLN